MLRVILTVALCVLPEYFGETGIFLRAEATDLAGSSSFLTNPSFFTNTPKDLASGNTHSQSELAANALKANPRLEAAMFSQIMFSVASGNVTDEANVVLQSKDGSLWAGSYAALTRYDGQIFRQMNDDDGVPISRVRALFEDSRGRLWIGTNNNGFYVREPGSIKKSNIIPQVGVRSFAETSDGAVYVGNSNGIICIDRDGKVYMITDSRITGSTVTSLCADRKDHVWGVTSGGNVFMLQGLNVESFYPRKYFEDGEPTCIYVTRSGEVYIGTTESHIFCLTDGGFARVELPEAVHINRIYEDYNGNVLICHDLGICYLDLERRTHNLDGLLVNSSIEDIVQDREFNYWIASSRKGIMYMQHSNFMGVTFAAKLPMEGYNAVARQGGKLYLGSDKGLVVLDQFYRQTNDPLQEFVRDVRIRSAITDSKENLWLACYKDKGVVRYKDGILKNWTTADGIPNEQVRCLLERRNGDIVAGTGAGIAIIRGDDVVNTIKGIKGFKNDRVLCLEEDSHGNLYIGSDGSGLLRIHGDGTMEAFNLANNGDRLGTVPAMRWDENNQCLWVSNGNNLYSLEGESLALRGVSELSFSNILDIQMIGDKVWLMRSTGIDIYDATSLKFGRVSGHHYIKYSDTAHSGLTANAKNLLTPEGCLYISGTKSVIAIDTKRLVVNWIPPQVTLDRIEVDDASGNHNYRPRNGLVLDKDVERVVIHIMMQSFADRNVTIKYYLDGVDEHPKEIKNADSNTYVAIYYNIPGGDHTFHLNAVNSDGVESVGETTFSFKKEKKIYEEDLFRILVTVAVIFAIWKGLNYYKRRVTERANRKAAEERKKRKESDERAHFYREVMTEAVRSITNIIDSKDEYTNGHSLRVARYARALAHKINLPVYEEGERMPDDLAARVAVKKAKEFEENIFYAGELHDVGKVVIDNSILKKQGRLTDEEYAEMKRHTVRGYEITMGMNRMELASECAHHHHERWDGRGYPDGIKGEEIPLATRIMTLADTVDAMYSTRVYRKGLSRQSVIDEILKCAGTQFDPALAKVMAQMLEGGYWVDPATNFPEEGAPEELLFDEEIKFAREKSMERKRKGDCADVNVLAAASSDTAAATGELKRSEAVDATTERPV